MGDEATDTQDWAFWRADSAFRSAGGIVGLRGKLAGSPYLYEVIRAVYKHATQFLATTPYGERFTQTSLFFVDSGSVNAVAAQRGRRRAVGVHVRAARGIAVLLGMPEGRWQGETTEEVRADRLEQEEQAFMEFSRALDDENEAIG